MEDYLRKVPLFRDIPPAKLAVLGEMCNYEFVKAGHRVCSEGEAGNEIFIVLDGHLAVFTSTSGTVLPLATLGPGDYFGELAALIRIKRIATVVSDEDTLLASIKRHDFRSFMTIMPDVRTAMDKVVKAHLLFKYSKVGNRFFPAPTAPSPKPPAPPASSSAATDKDRRLAFYALCEVEDVDADRIILYEHDAPGDVYYLSEGQVRLVRQEQDGGAPQTSIVLTAGAILGARAVVLNAPQQYTVVTDQVCVFLKLDAAAMAKHFANHPEIKATLEVLFKRRGTPLATLLECPEAHKVFETHLTDEFNSEHLDFYDDALTFKKLVAEVDADGGKEAAAAAAAPAAEQAASKLDHIHQQYLGLAAPSPVNIPHSMRERFLLAYDAPPLADAAETTAQRVRRLARPLEEVTREVLALMERDNFARFKNTEAFGKLLKHLAALLPTEPAMGAGGGGGGMRASVAVQGKKAGGRAGGAAKA